jgi:hypothetical protein
MKYELADIAVVEDVRVEKQRQIEKWGVQSHLDGTGPETVPLGSGEILTYSELADIYKAEFEVTHLDNLETWADILLEEVFEALAEENPLNLYAELYQVAAVTESWMRDILMNMEQRMDGNATSS